MTRLELVAAIRGSEPHMPISLVSISAADSRVTVASHDGCLRHYRYRPPCNAAGASKGLAASLSDETAFRLSPNCDMAVSSSHIEPAAHSGDVTYGEIDEKEHESKSGLSGNSRGIIQSGNEEAPAESLRAPEAAERSGEACNGHMQRTDHDREEQPSQPSRILEHIESRQQGDNVDNTPGERSEREFNSTALGDLNVEAVSALTVIESQLLYSSEGDKPDHLLSGFQVSNLVHLPEAFRYCVDHPTTEPVPGCYKLCKNPRVHLPSSPLHVTFPETVHELLML